MYLLDTNIIIFLFKGRFQIAEKLDAVGLEHCFISEITVAELKYGAEKSTRPAHHSKVVNEFIEDIAILPIFDVLDAYAREKARLAKAGQLIDDFDVLIGTTAVYHDLVLVTNNTSHLQRIKDIQLEDWTKV